MTDPSDSPEPVIESARCDLATVGRRLVIERLGPDAAAIAEETASRLLAHYNRLMNHRGPVARSFEGGWGRSQ
jgi:hypothetical protein